MVHGHRSPLEIPFIEYNVNDPDHMETLYLALPYDTSFWQIDIIRPNRMNLTRWRRIDTRIYLLRKMEMNIKSFDIKRSDNMISIVNLAW